MTPRATTIVRASGLGAAVIAAVLSPIPLADELVIGPGLLGVAAIVGLDRGLKLPELPWRVLVATAAAGLGARAALNLAVTSLPGVAAVVNAATAFALTRAYAEWADRACAATTVGSAAPA
ncbi:MAG TPA: hypothetical protein VF765_03695 [Polyangiaceae bacterium]